MKDAEGTEVLWPKNEIIRLFHETVLNTIGQVGLGLHHSLRRGTFGAWRRSLVLCCIHSNGQRRGALEGLGAPKQWSVLSQASPPKLAGLRGFFFRLIDIYPHKDIASPPRHIAPPT